MNPNDQKIYRYSILWENTFVEGYEIFINNVHHAYVSNREYVSFSILNNYLENHDIASKFYIKFYKHHMGKCGNYACGEFCGLFIREAIEHEL